MGDSIKTNELVTRNKLRAFVTLPLSSNVLTMNHRIGVFIIRTMHGNGDNIVNYSMSGQLLK